MSTKIIKTLRFPDYAASGNEYQVNAKYLDGYTAEQLLATGSGLTFRGGISGALSSPGTTLPSGNSGDIYKVSSAGWISGTKYEVGDTLICVSDDTLENTPNNWLKLQNNVDIATDSVSGLVKLGNKNNTIIEDKRPLLNDDNYSAYTTESTLDAGPGLKITKDHATDTRTVSIDDATTFIFVCGTANEHILEQHS